MTDGYGPDWDVDLGYGEGNGEGGESLVRDLLRRSLGDQPGQVHAEVKRKRIIDGELYVEMEHDPGRQKRFKASGLARTKAKFWAFNIHDTGITVIVPTVLLRQAAADRPLNRKQEKDGDCPTRGFLVSVGRL